MGNFFRSVADLKSEIDADPNMFLERLVHALDVAGRIDFHDDVKDAVVAISTAVDDDDLVGPAEILLDLLRQAIGIDQKVQRRTTS